MITSMWLLWLTLALNKAPAVVERRPVLRAEQQLIPFNPPFATYIRIGGHPYRIE